MQRNVFKGKVILVTGGTGSIGSEIVRQLLPHQPTSVRVFARHEERHFELMQEWSSHAACIRFIVGDIRDKERLALAMEGVDIVFHAAALKHVPLCEYNPFEAVKTNIVGTQNVIEAARAADVSRCIGISTDKVTEPEGILGASKLMAEKLFLASYYYKGDKTTKFACVRFGNVLGSRGSVLPLIKKKIAREEAVTVTDPRMTRFVMTIAQAVSLVLEAAALMQGQEVFILKMPAVRLSDLVSAAIAYYAPRFGKKSKEVPLRIIGKRDGEKRHERLLADFELGKAIETSRMYILVPGDQAGIAAYRARYPGAKPARRSRGFQSIFAPRLSKKELAEIIRQVDANI